MGLGSPSIMPHPEYGAAASYLPTPQTLLPKSRPQSGSSRPLHNRAQSSGSPSTTNNAPRHRTRTASINSVSSISSSIITSLGSTNISFPDSPTPINTATGDMSDMTAYNSMSSPYPSINQKSRPSIHARKAVAARVFECAVPGCNKAYTQLHNLKSHERTGHTPIQKPKPFLCIIAGCTKAFSQRKSLALHIRASHKEYKFKPFKCSQPSCQKAYTQLHNLRTHEKTVHMLDLSRKRIRNPAPNPGNGDGVSMTEGPGNDDSGNSDSNQDPGQIPLSGQTNQKSQLTSGEESSYGSADNLASYNVGMDDNEEEEGEDAEDEDEDENDVDYVDE
ncbi:hypothetical protein BGZ79_002124 [Entomortierella chlamydospora]|nr:hypothetical protein BGZ79_002124 [Entomortierella chlamydospora]